MRDDVKSFVELAARVFELHEPIVEIGAMQTPGQEGYADLRPFFPDKTYTGCDILPGLGVDRIEDVHELTFGDDSVGTVIVVETLEHVANPYRAVHEIHRVLRAEGVVIASAPFNFPIHHMPDYTRFTPQGMARLLNRFDRSVVFFQGDPQNPHTVFGVALKGDDEVAALRFEAAAARLRNDWYLMGYRDPLGQFEPLISVVRCDRPERRLEALVPGRRVEQSFLCTHNELTRIDVKLGCTGNISKGWIRLRLCDADGVELAPVETRATYVTQERWLSFEFPAVGNSAGRRFSFGLESSDPDSTVTPFASSEPAIDEGLLLVDGALQPGTLCFEVFCREAAVPETPMADTLVHEATAEDRPPVVETSLLRASLQARELYHIARALREAIEQLRADTMGRMNRLGDDLVSVEFRLESEAAQLVKMELGENALAQQLREIGLRQQANAEELAKTALQEQTTTELLAKLEVGQNALAQQLLNIEVRQQADSDSLVKGSLRQETTAQQLVKLEADQNALTAQLLETGLRQQTDGEVLAETALRHQAVAKQVDRLDFGQNALAQQLLNVELRQQADGERLTNLLAAVNDIRAFVATLRRNWLLRWISRLLGTSRIRSGGEGA